MSKEQEVESRREAFLKYREKRPRGCLADLGKQIGASPSWMSQIASGEAPISPELAVQLEQSTDGEISRKKLFPNTWEKIWPELAGVAA